MNDTLTLALIGHLVGDYLLQNDWMALNKKRHFWPCFIHALLWTLAVCSFAGWWQWLPASILFATHFWQDHTDVVRRWMCLIGQHHFMRSDDFDLTDSRVIPGLGPWSIIVVDNVWHIVTISAVWRFLIST